MSCVVERGSSVVAQTLRVVDEDRDWLLRFPVVYFLKGSVLCLYSTSYSNLNSRIVHPSPIVMQKHLNINIVQGIANQIFYDKNRPGSLYLGKYIRGKYLIGFQFVILLTR